VFVETRPWYLYLTRERYEDEERGRYVGQPPLREPSDIDALWAGLRSGVIHTLWSPAAGAPPRPARPGRPRRVSATTALAWRSLAHWQT